MFVRFSSLIWSVVCIALRLSSFRSFYLSFFLSFPFGVCVWACLCGTLIRIYSMCEWIGECKCRKHFRIRKFWANIFSSFVVVVRFFISMSISTKACVDTFSGIKIETKKKRDSENKSKPTECSVMYVDMRRTIVTLNQSNNSSGNNNNNYTNHGKLQ